jgi:hypothetical protein
MVNFVHEINQDVPNMQYEFCRKKRKQSILFT